jgi:Cof subfamily protein (haloacid dehalogenase superfamily)
VPDPGGTPGGIRLVALDMDGTLMGDGLSISPRVRRAIAAAQGQGVIVTIATGRMLEVAKPFARELAITAPLICYQGGLVQAPAAKDPLFIAPMDAALVREILAWASPQGWHAVLYTQSEAYAARGVHPPVFREILSQERIAWIDSLAAVAHQQQPVKLIFIDEPQVADMIESQTRRRFEGRMTVVRSHHWVVECSPLGVSKGAGLRRLAEHLSIAQSQTLAIGDQDNDIPMVAWAGVGVAMGDGSPAVRAAADWVAPTLAEDGAAAAIERFVLGT